MDVTLLGMGGRTALIFGRSPRCRPMGQVAGFLDRTVDTTVTHLADGAVTAIPRLASAVVIVAIALVGITALKWGLRRILRYVYPPEETIVIDLVLIVVSIFLWFGVGLTLLTVLGLEEIAASVGTAVGFIALGVSYALSEMIEDTVSGVYLLRDPDFNAGDHIETDKLTGEVVSIGLRKSRFRTGDGDTAVLANRSVESEWIRHIPGAEE